MRSTLIHHNQNINAAWQRLGPWIARFISWQRQPGRNCIVIITVTMLVSLAPQPTGAATYEFEGPYAIRVLHQGLELEFSGTLSWAVPQQFGIALAQAPNVRIVRLNSPGGHIKAAVEVADIIHARHLDTYVPQTCASACTIAFLAGNRRIVSASAKLGFHQAHGPGLSSEQSNVLLEVAYQRFSLPSAFIAHVLRLPPWDLWTPDLAELRKVGIVTEVAPDGAFAASVP
jgi:hypothetical protein